MEVTVPQVSSADASKRTLQRRGLQGDQYTQLISSDCGEQQRSSDLKRKTKEAQNRILSGAGIKTRPTKMPALKTLAMKTALNWTWRQTRGMRSFCAEDDIKFECEQKMRAEKRKLIGNHMTSEKLTFTFTGKDKKIIQKKKPYVFVCDLTDYTLELIKYYDQTGKLSNQNGVIPDHEIWIKVGADHGQGSFKFCLQVVNAPKPNSTTNTVIISAAEAPDHHQNVVKMLERFADQLDDLRSATYMGKSLPLMGAADIEMIKKNSGMASGNPTHPCYKCKVSRADMQKPRSKRGRSKKRTLANLAEDYQGYAKAGFKKSEQSKYYNVINKPILPIEPEDWITPYLHDTLGEILKYWSMIRDKFQVLDLKICDGLSKDGGYLGDSDLEQCIDALKQMDSLKEQVETLECEMESVTDSLKLIGRDSDQKIISQAEVHLSRLDSQKKKLEQNMIELQSKYEIKIGMGPLVQGLERTLEEHGIDRELYHGGIFNGNACDKFLNVYLAVFASIERLLHKVAIELKMENIYIEGKLICDQFCKLFELRSTVHKLVGHTNPIKGAALLLVQPAIDAYLSHFRATFPDCTITVKMHLMEDHAFDDIKKYGCGLGLLGEQGFESIHRKFKGILQGHSHMAPSKRLLYAVEEHQLSTNPVLRKYVPEKKSRMEESTE